LKATVTKRKVYIFISNNLVLVLDKSNPRVKLTNTAVIFKSPLLDTPIPIPISK